jgi:uncharacterized protein (TIGR01244 family)
MFGSEVEGPFDWSGVRVMQMGKFYISGQLNVESLAQAKEAGVETIINIREPEEMTWDEESAVVTAGFDYHHIPVSRQGAYEPAAFTAIKEASAGDEPIWLHCASGNRAAGWFAAYLVIEKGYDIEEALAIGDRLGITSDAIRQKVRDYVALNQRN